MRYLQDSHMEITPAKAGVQNVELILDFLRGGQARLQASQKFRPTSRGNDKHGLLQLVLMYDSIMAENILDSFFTAETQRAQRERSLICREIPANKIVCSAKTKLNKILKGGFKPNRRLPIGFNRIYPQRPLRLCGDNLLFGSTHGAEQE